MLKEVEVVEEGFEKVVEVLKNIIDEIEIAQEAEINLAIDNIKNKYASRLDRYNEELSHLVHTETIELPDEISETDEIPEGADVVNTVEYIGE